MNTEDVWRSVKDLAEKEIGCAGVPATKRTYIQQANLRMLTDFGTKAVLTLTCRCGGFFQEKFNNGLGALVCTECGEMKESTSN